MSLFSAISKKLNMSEEERANTSAHELNHARDFIRGGIAPESSAYSSGNALSDYIMGGR